MGKHLLGAVNAEESYNRAFILVLAGVIVVLYSLAKLDAKFKWNMLSDMAQRVVFVLVPPLALVFGAGHYRVWALRRRPRVVVYALARRFWRWLKVA